MDMKRSIGRGSAYAKIQLLRGLAENRSERQIVDDSGMAYATAWISVRSQLPEVSALAIAQGLYS